MPLGTCKMCLQEKELLRSHLIPRAVHEYTTAGGHKPITLRKGVLMSGNVQLQDYLLCLGCEQILNDGGEDWTVDKLATHEGQFPLYDLVTAKEAHRSFNTTRVYFMVDRPEVPFEKLVHFGMGMFFKAAVHPWEGGKIDPRIELGTYAESLRRWLRGDAGFPKHVCLVIQLTPRSEHMPDFSIRTKRNGMCSTSILRDFFLCFMWGRQ